MYTGVIKELFMSEENAGQNPYVEPVLSHEQQLAWLIELGYTENDIASLTEKRKGTVNGWLKSGEIDSAEAHDRIWALYTAARGIYRRGMYHPQDIVGMTRSENPLLMRRSLVGAIALMPESRHEIASRFAETVVSPETAEKNFGEVAKALRPFNGYIE
jgi:hypothetical protein